MNPPPVRIVSAEKRPEDDAGAPAADARRFRRPGGGAGQSQGVHRIGQDAQRSARPRAVRRPAGPRQDDAGADRRARARRQFPRHLRAGDRQGRRPRRAAHQPRAARRAVHRRDPSAQPGGRGNPLSGDGGFPARPDHRRRAGGALGQDRPGEVHPDRRDDPRRPADDAVARPLRHSDPAQFLLGRGARGHRAARRAGDRPGARRRRRQRDRPPLARHAAHRRPPAAPGARFRRRRGGGGGYADDRRPGAANCSTSTRPASTRWTAAISK